MRLSPNKKRKRIFDKSIKSSLCEENRDDALPVDYKDTRKILSEENTLSEESRSSCRLFNTKNDELLRENEDIMMSGSIPRIGKDEDDKEEENITFGDPSLSNSTIYENAALPQMGGDKTFAQKSPTPSSSDDDGEDLTRSLQAEEMEEMKEEEVEEVEEMNVEGKEEEMEVEANFMKSDDFEKKEGVSEYDLKEEVKVGHDTKVVLGMSIENAKEILDNNAHQDSFSEYAGSKFVTSATSGVASKDIRIVQQNTPPHTNKMVTSSITSGLATAGQDAVQRSSLATILEDRDIFQRSSLTTILEDPDALQRSSLATILEDPVTNAVEMNSLSLSTITPEMAEFVCSNVIKVAAVMTFYLKSCNNRKLDFLQNVFSFQRRRPG